MHKMYNFTVTKIIICKFVYMQILALAHIKTFVAKKDACYVQLLLYLNFYPRYLFYGSE